jgi:tRNA A37 threonylcarbamoyladenosine synthetase subunit TsaC/SUA5/YrdC
MVWDEVAIFPQTSVAVHVLVTLYSPAQSPLVVTSANVNVNVLPQLSLAEAAAKTGMAGQFIVVTPGNGSITGAVISCTFIVCEAVEALPQASVAVQVLVTLYSPAQSPFVVASLNVKVKELPHASLAVASANAGVAGQLIVVTPGNGSITGAVISCTFIVCEAEEALPQASVAVQVLVTLYSPVQSPFVVTSANVSVKVLPQASIAEAAANTGVAGQLIVVGPGSGLITGAVISCTLMVCEAVDELPQPSVAVQVLVTLYSPAQSPGVVTSACVSVNALPQASVAVATAKTGVAGQLIVVGEGNGAITGGVTSCTFMV